MRVRGHAADRADPPARRRVPADWGPLHDGPRGGGNRAGAPRRRALRPLPFRNLSGAGRHARAAARAGSRRRAGRGDSAWRESRPVRERWLGATGRRVPEIAVDGELDVPDGALVLDEVSNLELLHRAHAEGRPVLVRASTPEGVKAALARPEVAS